MKCNYCLELIDQINLFQISERENRLNRRTKKKRICFFSFDSNLCSKLYFYRSLNKCRQERENTCFSYTFFSSDMCYCLYENIEEILLVVHDIVVSFFYQSVSVSLEEKRREHERVRCTCYSSVRMHDQINRCVSFSLLL